VMSFLFITSIIRGTVYLQVLYNSGYLNPNERYFYNQYCIEKKPKKKILTNNISLSCQIEVFEKMSFNTI